jgi:integrase
LPRLVAAVANVLHGQLRRVVRGDLAEVHVTGELGSLRIAHRWSARFDLHNFRNRTWKPAQIAVGIKTFRRIYDLKHTFATFALRAGLSTFELSRYMGASLTMIDRHYGHLARDGRSLLLRRRARERRGDL